MDYDVFNNCLRSLFGVFTKIRKIQKRARGDIKTMLFLNNKKKKILVSLFVFFVIGGSIFVDVRPVFAAAGCESLKDFIFYAWAKDSSCGLLSMSGNVILSGLKWVVYEVFVFFGALGSLAVIIFTWAINPSYISGDGGLLNLQGVYNMWKFIRDFFNLFFILVLLYIAFKVVFQVEKNFKQALLSLVLAALLVNFSFPISRVMIDATNVPMYFFANQIFENTGTKGAFGQALDASKLKNILIPKDVASTDMSRLLAATVFMFLFSVTLLVLAIMFVIRLIALMVLVIFSSVGFAASIIPGLEKYSQMWWENFWKYALFGPAAMLMLLIAVGFFVAIGDENGAVFKGLQNAGTNLTAKNETTFYSSMAMFSIPIILLWMAIGLGQKMALVGGDIMAGKGHAFAKWAGGKFSGYSALKRNWDAYSGARKKRTDEKNKNNFGARIGSDLSRIQDTLLGIYGPTERTRQGATNRADKINTQETEEAGKNRGVEFMNPSDLRNLAQTGNRYERAAALKELANKQALDLSDPLQMTQYQQMLQEFGNTSAVFRQINTKLRAYDPAGAFSHIVNRVAREEAIGTHVNSNQFDAKKLNARSLANHEFMEIAFREQAITNKDLEELRNKSQAHEQSIIISLGAIAGNFAANPGDRVSQNVQLAHLAQTGDLHATVAANGAWRQEVYSHIDKDTAKRMSTVAINRDVLDIATHINPRHYKTVIQNMNNAAVLNRWVQGMRGAGGNAGVINRISTGDPEISHIN